MSNLAPPPGWETPDVPNGAFPPVLGPEGGTQIMAAPPGSAQDAGSSDLIAPTVAQAVAKAFADMAEHESDTHVAGSNVGDIMPLPPAPDVDTTVLQGPPD